MYHGVIVDWLISKFVKFQSLNLKLNVAQKSRFSVDCIEER